jgi:hypothetical protein
VIDELGYLALPAEAAAALFQVVSQRYLKTSIVITSNRGVGVWGEILGDNTVAAALRDGQRKPASWRLVRKPTDTGGSTSRGSPTGNPDATSPRSTSAPRIYQTLLARPELRASGIVDP